MAVRFATTVRILLESPMTLNGPPIRSSLNRSSRRAASCLYKLVASSIAVGRSNGSLNDVSWPLSRRVRS